MNLLNLLAKLTTVRIEVFAESGDLQPEPDNSRTASIEEGANAVCSQYTSMPGYHAIALDLDVPAFLVPSSTPGHSHLYIDRVVKEDDYFTLLNLLAKIGVLESNYVIASKSRGGTYLRLPWVKKNATS